MPSAPSAIYWIAETDLQWVLARRRTHRAFVSAGQRGWRRGQRCSGALTEQGRPPTNLNELKTAVFRGRRRNGRRTGRDAVGSGRTAGAGHPDLGRNSTAANSDHGAPVQPGRHAQRLDPALAHEQWRQGISPDRRANRARSGARLQGQHVGLQRSKPRPDH